MIKLMDLLKEAKQVGNLYHFTYTMHAPSIFKKGLLFSPDNTRLAKHEGKFYISTTRDYSDTGKTYFKDSGFDARITLDGNKISEHYSIEPISIENIWTKQTRGDYTKSSKDVFYEERIFSSKGGYLDPKYIIKIDTTVPEDEIRRQIEWGKENRGGSVRFNDSIFDYVNSGKLNFVKNFNSK